MIITAISLCENSEDEEDFEDEEDEEDEEDDDDLEELSPEEEVVVAVDPFLYLV